MLKWLVTGREGGESPRVTKMRTDDGDDGGNNGNKYSMFHVNRVNPIFSEVDDHHVENHHQPPKHKQLHQDHHQELHHPERSKPAKKHNFYIPESYSSGYWSFNDGSNPGGLHHMSRMLAPTAELETCYNISSSVDISTRQRGPAADAKNIPPPHPVWPGPGGESSDRCFEIRHQRLNVSSGKSRTDFHNLGSSGSTVMQKSCTSTESTAIETHESDSDRGDLDQDVLSEEGDNDSEDNIVTTKSKEDMDRVIAELTSALIQSKGVSALTNAVNKNNDYTETNYVKKTNNAHHAKNPRMSRNLHISPNKLYLHKKKKEIVSKKKGYDNTAYSSEETEDTFESGADRNFTRFQHLGLEQLHPAFLHPPTKSSHKYFRGKNIHHDKNISVPHSGSWHLSRKSSHHQPFYHHPAITCGELDYKNYNYNYGMFLSEELYRSRLYTTNNKNSRYRKKKQRKCVKKLCKLFCFLVLLISFILVIVCVSVFIIKDKYDT